MNRFGQIDNVYIIGIGGIGISALARYFNALGKTVAGYDLHRSELTERLQSEGMGVSYLDNVDTVPPQFISNRECTLVIYTPAIPADNKIFSFFKNNGFDMHKRAEVLGMIADNYTTIAISGTDDKFLRDGKYHTMCRQGWLCIPGRYFTQYRQQFDVACEKTAV